MAEARFAYWQNPSLGAILGWDLKRCQETGLLNEGPALQQRLLTATVTCETDCSGRHDTELSASSRGALCGAHIESAVKAHRYPCCATGAVMCPMSIIKASISEERASAYLGWEEKQSETLAPDPRPLGESHNGSQADAHSRADSIRPHVSKWKPAPELVFDVDSANVDVIIHREIEPAPWNQGQEIPTSVSERQLDMSVANQKLRIRLPPAGSYEHPWPGKIILL